MPPRAQGKLGPGGRKEILRGGKTMIAIGADVHKQQCTLAVQRPDGKLSMLPSMDNTRENWLDLLTQLSSGSPDRPGGLDQRSLCDERVGGGGLAGSSSLGAHRRHRQSAQAEDGPPGCP